MTVDPHTYVAAVLAAVGIIAGLCGPAALRRAWRDQ